MCAAKVGAHHCTPIAWGVADKEDSQGYIELLKTIAAVPGCRDLVDHKDSMLWTDLGSAIEKAITDTENGVHNMGLHGRCNVHLYEAAIKRAPGMKTSNLHGVFTAKTEADLHYHSARLKKDYPEVYKMLFEEYDPKTWQQKLISDDFPSAIGTRTNNDAEIMNWQAKLRDLRTHNIVDVMTGVLELGVHLVSKIKECARFWCSERIEKGVKVQCQKQLDLSKHYHVRPAGTDGAYLSYTSTAPTAEDVRTKARTVITSAGKWTCSCNEPTVNKSPCRHIFSVATHVSSRILAHNVAYIGTLSYSSDTLPQLKKITNARDTRDFLEDHVHEAFTNFEINASMGASKLA